MLKRTCTSCGKDRKKNNLVYDTDLNAYCKAIHDCNTEHPNSTFNLIKNAKIVKMYDYNEAVVIFSEMNKSDTIKHMSNPITIRLSDIKQALHIEKVCAERDISISDYIRELVQKDMQNEIAQIPAPIATKYEGSDLIF